MSKLVIVESPAKAKTIKKYLGRGYEVVASMGHVIDLPKSQLGVDIENNFTPKYIQIKGKAPLVKELKAAAKKSDKIFLATDPDREGEAISWHLANMLGLSLSDKNRVTFNEITKSGVKSGMAAPRTVDMDLVNAQQARRILDRIVGYKLSPFLWKKVRRGLSAGRVQSAAVGIIVDRENEIRAFKPQEYWDITAELLKDGTKKPFSAKFYGTAAGKKVNLKTKADTDKILEALQGASYTVSEVKKGTRKRTPAPPFITSTLQQEASRRLGFQASRTMRAAQQLYEGVEIKGTGAVGLITYMRTDSLRISDEAHAGARAFITEHYDAAYLPKTSRSYQKKKGAQDAHEAIRPTNVDYTPAAVKDSLSTDQYKLYKLIWERFVASEMSDAVLDTVSASVTAGDYLFKASGYSVRFDGFTVLYDSADKQEKGTALPPLEKGDALQLHRLSGDQHFTEPPARYTEASLIKTLEENGIGRPSTYAPTIATILDRGYVVREQKSLKPTQSGEVVTELLREFFSDIVDVKFTAKMEEDLDKIEEGGTDWVGTLSAFYGPFKEELEHAEKAMEGQDRKIPDEETDIVCEKCGRNMVIKTGRFGKFLACPGYPECKNTKKIVVETPGVCPKCGGKILEKKSKAGRKYFGCENNPKCDFMTWDTPTADKCPQCGSTLFKKAGRAGKTYCAKDGCGFVKGE